MKKIKVSVIIITLAFIISMAGSGFSIKADAAYNVVKRAKTVKSTSGMWKNDGTGSWFQLYNGKYPKNSWKKIGGRIYYFNKNGYMETGWKLYKKFYYYLEEAGKKRGSLAGGFKTVFGKRYYLSKSTGAMYTGWKMINGKRYYFDINKNNFGAMVKNRWVDSRYLMSDGAMAVNRKVGKYYVGPDGRKIAENAPSKDNKTDVGTPQNPGTNGPSGSTAVKNYDSYIFVGDSRTVGMKSVVGSKAGHVQYIAKTGEGYSWLQKKAAPKLKKILDVNPYTKVVFNLGVNDCASGTINSYIQTYRKLMAEYPGTKFYFMSVNPVNNKAAKKAGYIVKNKHITAFNASLRAAFEDQYIDSYTYLVTNGYDAVDGLHYGSQTYEAIYEYVLESTK